MQSVQCTLYNVLAVCLLGLDGKAFVNLISLVLPVRG